MGRSRWQKNHGDELEHRDGHGRKNLRQVCYQVNLLASVTRRIVETGDRLYQRGRERASLRELWGD